MKGRLLYLVNSPEFFLSHRLAVAEAARQAGCDVHVATPDGPRAAGIRERGFIFHCLDLTRRSMRPWDEGRCFASIVSVLRSIRPTLVHNITIKPVLYGGVAARLLGVPAVLHALTGLGYLFISRSTRDALVRAALLRGLRLALEHPNSLAVFQNPDDREAIEAAGVISRSRSALIRGSGVDTEIFRPIAEPEGLPVVLLASRMLWMKGVEEFVAAARQLKEAGVRARFALVGDTDPGNPAAVPRSQLERWREMNEVEWWGHQEDMVAVFRRANIVTLPSHGGEGVPKVLIEAAACGRSIVTTDVPGCREVVRDGENGLLVPPRDAGALARALGTLLADSERRQQMGRKGRVLAESEFSVKQVISATLNLYRELLARAEARGKGRMISTC